MNLSRFRKSSFGAAAALSLSLLAPAAHAGLAFQFTFGVDPTDPNAVAFTAQQQQAIITSGQLFSAMFATHFTNSATLQFDVLSQSTGVASASSDAVLSATTPSVEVVQTKVQTGVDVNGTTADGTININFLTNDFVLDPNAPVVFNAGQLDLFSVLDHELTHALGFLSLAGLNSGFFQNKFDQFLTTLAGMPIIDPVTGLIDQAALADAGLHNGLFIGANAVAANGGAGVSIQGQDGNPAAFSGALSHLGTIAFSAPPGGSPNQNALMLCCGGLNVTGEPRDYNAAEIGILADLGYTRVSANAVPEPESIALLGIGWLAAFGAVRLRRRA